jgi:transcriptional regulator with XRE-family HTH domain
LWTARSSGAMNKSLYSPQYRIFLSTLRQVRTAASLSQSDLATRLNTTQSFISKCERGDRRIDVVELRAFCGVMNISFVDFVKQFETALERSGGS